MTITELPGTFEPDALAPLLADLELASPVELALTLATLYQECGRLVQNNLELQRQLAAARIDPLTGLPTRAAWTAQADRIIHTPTNGTARHCVLLLDLNGFKEVNDTYKHAAGDALLKVQAKRLTAWCEDRGERGEPGRLGGDEMVAAITFDTRDIEHELDHLGAILAKPMLWNGTKIYAPASIGVALADEHGTTPLGVLLGAADHAMYEAKKARGFAGWWRLADPNTYLTSDPAPVHRFRDVGFTPIDPTETTWGNH
jgi:diguanylate cyclase (GGDEF)-like protein